MASDINPSSSAFATSQMKPDNSEEANSLWAKNIADNTGWLYQNAFARKETIFTLPLWNGTMTDSVSAGSYVNGTLIQQDAGTLVSFLWEAHASHRNFLYYRFKAWGNAASPGAISFFTNTIQVLSQTITTTPTLYSGTINVGTIISTFGDSTFLIRASGQSAGFRIFLYSCVIQGQPV